MSLLPAAERWLLSPTAMGYIPSLVMQTIILGDLLSRRSPSTATKLFTGWTASLILFIGARLAAYTIYAPLSGYRDWIGAIAFAWLALILSLQLAYHFPRPTFAREARVVLWISITLGVGFVLWMMYEALLTTKMPT
jgi:hypothetical protein